MRTTITQNTCGYVTVSYDDEYGERVTREFFCPANGGYVRECRSDGNHPQVCDRLSRLGNTLTAADRDDLLAVIRREYRAMRRAEKREASRF